MMQTKNRAPCVPLHFRSYFSLMQGLYSPEEICAYARSQGYPAVGMVDINNLYGLIRFLKAAEAEHIKALAGVDIRVNGRELFTAYILNHQGFIRLAGIITSLLYDTSPYPRQPAPLPYDPAADLVTGGWQGLAIASEDPGIITQLAAAGKSGLFCKLVYGKSFINLVRLAGKMGLPVLAVNDAVYIKDEEQEIYNMLRAIDLNTPIFRLPEQEKITRPRKLAGSTEMENYFSAVPEALLNGWKLATEASTEGIISRSFVFPEYGGLSREMAFETLKELCNRGIRKRYGAETPDITARLRYELGIIEEKNFSSYFLVVNDIVAACPRTCGRGSSASSLVSYLLGITHIDPLKFNLFFERFLNRGRKDPPDIDVDFPWDERSKVFAYVFDKYRGRAAMVANQITLAGRASLRETAKALGMTGAETTRLMRLHHLRRDREIPQYVKHIADAIRGFPNYIGLHCGGVVITPQPITCYTHIQPSVAGYPVIAWEKDGAEDAGLVKIDLLGNRSLAVLRETIKLIKKRHHRELDWADFSPVKDRGAQQLIEKGNTLGIFYIESPATRQLLQKMRTGKFENIVIASSIIRPAANPYIRKFVKRMYGEPFTPLHPLVAGTLEETFGILVYQEDVSRVAIDLAGFSIEEADALRKIIAKKDRGGRIGEYKDRFFAGGRAKGAGEAALNEAWEMILSFQGYSFCKAHSASYALVSYKLAYCKACYPAEFLVSVINNGGGFYTRQTYLNELKRTGTRVLPPDLNKSRYRYALEGVNVRIGFCQLADISRPFVKRIIQERREKPFKSLADFILRLKPGLPEMRILIRSGTLDSIAGGLTRPQMFWFYFTFCREDSLFLLPPVPAFIGDYSAQVKLMDEMKTLGIIYSRHPLQIFRKRIAWVLRKQGIPRIITSQELPACVNRYVYRAGLIVTGKEVYTWNNERMIFVSFEDPYSVYETVFFPGTFKKYHHLLESMGVYLLYGKVENELGALLVNVQSIVRLNREPDQNGPVQADNSGYTQQHRQPGMQQTHT